MLVAEASLSREIWIILLAIKRSIIFITLTLLSRFSSLATAVTFTVYPKCKIALIKKPICLLDYDRNSCLIPTFHNGIRSVYLPQTSLKEGESKLRVLNGTFLPLKCKPGYKPMQFLTSNCSAIQCVDGVWTGEVPMCDSTYI